MSKRPPRPLSSQGYQSESQQQQPPLVSLQDGFAFIDDDGEIHVGRRPNSVVFRKRTVSSQPLGRSSPMVPDGRYKQLPKDFTYGLPNKQDAEHTDQILHSWEETKAYEAPPTLRKVAPGLEQMYKSKQRSKQRAASSRTLCQTLLVLPWKLMRDRSSPLWAAKRRASSTVS